LIVGRLVPAFGSLSRRKFDDHGAGVLPLTFKLGQLAAASDELAAERCDCAGNLLSMFGNIASS